MPTNLYQNINSDRTGRSNVLRRKDEPKIILVFVESDDDIAFWREVLNPYENNKLKFRINLPSNNSLEKGKNKADRKSTHLNSSHVSQSRMPSSA